jgi:hypothetical protein
MNQVYDLGLRYILENPFRGLIDIRVTFDGPVYSEWNDYLALFGTKGELLLFLSLHLILFFVFEWRLDSKITSWGEY